ncbi:chemotaxis protein CheW [Faecalispora anaeroviscerum]|uniref:chemotaxis protein CheW n=1 Tax=Faecalispora anaeroviscerum TaxID=2991836 RepID=UPI0024BBC753|nr:chemotaxis protein CheW [Faecalispora anaeroviscerum]
MEDTINTIDTIDFLDTANQELDGKYLTFFLDNQLFGVPISDVVQIIGMQEITPVPDSPVYAKGIINLRGSIIPLIDIRLRFGKPELEYNDRTCIIVTKLEETYIGFLVDSVNEVSVIEEENISATPTVISGNSTNTYVTGIGRLHGKVVLLVDPKKILNNEEMKQVEKVLDQL